MRHGAITGIVAIFVLAGCIQASGEQEVPGGTAQPVGPGEVDPNSEFGVLQGTVLNEEASPIAGAQIALQGTDFVTAADAAGLFVFRDVPPGRQTVLVGALGYESQGRTVDVASGQVASVAFVLKAIEVAPEGYVEILHFTGFFECAMASPVWISSCSYPYTAVYGTANNSGANPGLPEDVQNNKHRFNITIRKDVAQLQAELMWTPSSAAATRMTMLFLCGDYDPVLDDCTESIRYGSGSGTDGISPIKVMIDGEEFVDKGKGSVEYDLTKQDEIWIMNYVGLPFGDPQVAFQQKFEVWDSVFYHVPGPDDWTVINDV